MTAPGIEVLGMEVLLQTVTERALNSIAGGMLIAAFAWLVLRVVGRQNSGTRFAVWFLALIAIAGLPFAPGLSHAGSVTHSIRAAVTLPGSWALAIFAVWIFLAAVAVARLVIGLWKLRCLRRSGVALAPSSLPASLRETLAQCEAVRPVTVRSSRDVKVPTAIGFFKPVILIPEWTLQELPTEELRVILLHEFAHLRRWDDWTNLAQKIIRTILFFHPAVWWIEKRLSVEREMACDDAVLAETGNPRAYAECLISLAEKSFVRRSLVLAQAAISHARETSMRLAQILDSNRTNATRVSWPALSFVTASAGFILLLLPNSPRLIAFESGGPSQHFSAASESYPPRMQAAVVPAALRGTVSSAAVNGIPSTLHNAVRTPAIYRPSKPVASGFAHGRVPHSNEVKFQQHSSAVLPVKVVAKQEAPPQEFLLVMQTTEYDPRGSFTFSVSVWRVMLASADQNAIQQGVVAGKI